MEKRKERRERDCYSSWSVEVTSFKCVATAFKILGRSILNFVPIGIFPVSLGLPYQTIHLHSYSYSLFKPPSCSITSRALL